MYHVQHRSPLGEWDLVTRAPDPCLRAYVTSYHGYVEHCPSAARRRELPGADVVLIIAFGAPWRLVDPRDPARPPLELRSFVGGLSDIYTLSEVTGPTHTLQVNFTPLGAYRFFGLPMETLANRVVAFEDVGGAAARDLIERLYLAGSWEARFALLDAAIAAKVTAAWAPSHGVVLAWHRLTEAAGQVEIGALAEEIGWSRKHLNLQFREQVGLSPKTMARVLRFQRAVRLLERGDGRGLADIALDCGYYDQAHLVRDFRAFAGSPPSEFVERRLPDGTGVLDNPDTPDGYHFSKTAADSRL